MGHGMGIEDRDYMKRGPDDEHRRSSYSPGEPRFAGWLGGLLARCPRLGLWFAVVLAVVILVALILARLSL